MKTTKKVSFFVSVAKTPYLVLIRNSIQERDGPVFLRKSSDRGRHWMEANPIDPILLRTTFTREFLEVIRFRSGEHCPGGGQGGGGHDLDRRSRAIK